MQTIKNLLSPLAGNSNPIQDTLVSLLARNVHSRRTLTVPDQKLVVIGGTVETARRASVSAWNGFIDCESARPDRRELSPIHPDSPQRSS
ncbi:hypothetical protein BD413DRAFT_163032 [Trametes elegans]|nr:hypothetical protein BD413DRAFT_163032 [Trametes elegans]